MTTEAMPAFEREPYLRTLTTYVRSSGRGAQPFVVLEDTILYPEGGGQPSDRGTIGGVPVLDVQRVAGEIRHVLTTPLDSGPVEVVLDWERRYDFMQQHTAQHLLTAIAQDGFGWPTVAFHLGDRAADIELDVPDLGHDALFALEAAVAEHVRAAVPVRAVRVARDALATLPVRTRGLPEGFAGPVRLVQIEGIDLNTCGGTHLLSTAEIECVKLLGTEPMRGGTRLHFVAGGRVRRLLGEHEARNATLRALFGAPDHELPSAAEVKLEQLRDAVRRVRNLEEELAESAAASIAAATGAVASAHWPDRDAAFLQRVAKSLVPLAPARVALLTAGAGEEGPFVLCAGDSVTVDLPAVGKKLAETLGGRGGGSGRVFQGKASALSKRGQAIAELESTLR